MTLAMQDVAVNNIRLAYKIARSFQGCGIDFEELNSLALLGLVKAASTFDESKGFKFSSYAVPVIRHEILAELRILRRFKDTVSLDAENPIPGSDGECCTLLDLLPYEEPGFRKIENADLMELLTRTNLKEKERTAVMLVVCNGRKQSEVGQLMGVTQAHVSKCVKSGIDKIQKEYWRKGRKLA